MNRIVQRSFGGLFFLFASFSVVGYLLYGKEVSDNVLGDLGGEGFWHQVAQLGAALAVLGVYPILINPMVAPVRSSPVLTRFTNLAIIVTVFCSGLGAIVVGDSLGSLSIVNGAICAGVFMGGLPALVGYILLNKPPWQMCLLGAAGFLATILGVVFMDNYVSELKCFAR